MRARLLALGFLGAIRAFAYTYDSSSTPLYTPTWSLNGSIDAGSPATRFYSGGSLIYPGTVSGANSNDYEVKTTLSIQPGGGTFVHYLRASSNALASSGACAGSYYSVELNIPAGTYYNPGAAQIYLHQCASGSLSTLASASAAVWDGAVLRSVIWGTNLWVYLDGVLIFRQAISSTTGQPGIGGYRMYSGGFSSTSVGPHDVYAPDPVSTTGVRSSILPTSVMLAWQGVTDDTNAAGGIGVYGYKVVRDGTNMGMSLSASFADQGLTPGVTYSYAISAVDYHGNVGTATSYPVTMPPLGAVDPRRVGLFTTGSYWGGGGEQIDTLSGNLNFSLPLVKPQGRTGWTVPVNLVYNAQNWRHDSGFNWELGDDTGYGFGWKVQIGSVTPYYKGWPNGVDHYVFTDSTGAEYRLDQPSSSGTVWSSTQGIYVWFDANASVLHFKDGTFWRMGAMSGGAEQDAGTMYPTIIEDPDGNQVIVTYNRAPSLPLGVANTSGRIAMIADVRGPNYCGSGCYVTYNFIYDTTNPSAPLGSSANPFLPHLMQIANYISTAETYQFNYSSSPVPVNPPFGSTDTNYSGVTTKQLASVAVTGIGTYSLTYDLTSGASASELTQVTFPWGGYLGWSYVNATYAGGRWLREVQNRYLNASSSPTSATLWTYPFVHSDSGATIATVHADTTVADASGVGSKTWTFNLSSSTWTPNGAWQIGLAAQFTQNAGLTSSTTVLTQDTYAWTLTPGSSTAPSIGGNPYIATKTSVSDGTSSATTKQQLDAYGNLTQLVVYPYNNITTALQTYTNTYLSSSAYASYYVLNRLLNTTLTTSGGMKTPVQNLYDAGSCGIAGFYGSGGTPTPQFDMSQSIPMAYRGLLTQTTTPAKWTCIQYDGFGNVSQATGSDGSTVTATNTSSTNYAAPTAVSAQSFTTAIAYNSWLGMTQTTGPNGEQMYLAYDVAGRPATATSPYGTYGSPTVTYSYSSTLPAWQAKTGPDGYTKTTLDGLGRVIEVDRGPNSSSIQSVTTTVYAPCACSPLAKIQKISQPYAPSGSWPYAPTSSTTWTTYTYDGIGRTLAAQLPDASSTTHYVYTGNLTTVTDPAGNWKKFTRDVLGNLTTVEEPNPPPTGGTLTTSYTYDWMNHLYTSTMTRGSTTQTRTFAYNDAGQLTSATNPENGTVTYTYNTDGTLLKKVDAKYQAVVYSYDSQKRVIQVKRYPGAIGAPSTTEDACQRVTYSYDTNPVDSTFSANSAGRLTAVQYSIPTNCSGPTADTYAEEYSYHAAGGVTAKRFLVTRTTWDDYGMKTGTAKLDATYTYDSAGRQSAAAYPVNMGIYPTLDPTMVTYTYGFDSMGRPASLTDDNPWSDNTYSTNWVQNVAYDLAGRRTSMQRLVTSTDSYATETKSYNVNGQLASLGWSGSGAPAGTITYCYTSCTTPSGDNGQITQMTDSISGETVTYAYDTLKRLISATSTVTIGGAAVWNEQYGYDGFGNMMSMKLNGGTNLIPAMDSTTNQFTSGYDLNGNMLGGTVGGTGVTLAYDEANRLASASPTSGGTEYYGYAPDNKRVYRLMASGGQEWTFYGARGEKIGVYSMYDPMCCDDPGSGEYYFFTPRKTNVWFAGQLISEGGLHLSHLDVFSDRLGTNRASGAKFYPYGDEITSTSNDREKFGTYTRDSFSGLDYADQRYYASSYGRFNTADQYQASAGPSDPGTWNRYSYTAGDPVNRNDRRGLEFAICGGYEGDGGDGCNDGGWGGDGWGGGGFGIYYFYQPPGGGGGGGGGGGSQTAPECDVELFTRPVSVGGVFSLGSFGTHSYLEVWDSSGETTIEGGPATTNLSNPGLLTAFVTSNGVQYSGATGDNPGSDNHQGQYAASCSSVGAAIADGKGFKSTLTYNAIFGPNSNSFMNWLLGVSGLSYLFPNPPAGSVGWNDPVLQSGPLVPLPVSGPGKGGFPPLPRLGIPR